MTEKTANTTIVKLTDSNMASSSIREMTAFLIQTRDIRNPPKKASIANVCRITIYCIPNECECMHFYLFPGYQASNSSYNISLVEKSGVARAVVEVSCFKKSIQTFSHGTDSESLGHNCDVWERVILFPIIVYSLYKM